MGEAGAVRCGACPGIRGFLTSEAVLRPKVVFRTIGRVRPERTEGRPRGKTGRGRMGPPLGSGRGGGWGPSMWRLLWASWVLDMRSSPSPEGHVPYSRPGSSDGDRRPAPGEEGGLRRKGPPVGPGRGGGWGPSMWRLLWGSWVLDMRSSPVPEGRLLYNRPGSFDGGRRPAPGEKGGLGRKGPPLGSGRGGGWGPSMWRLLGKPWVRDTQGGPRPQTRFSYGRPGSSREDRRPAPGQDKSGP